jgi:peptide/nickel transport system substrate-binding protein
VVEKDGKSLQGILLVSEDINTGAGGRSLVIAEAVQHSLKKVGMDIQIKQLELGAALRAEGKGDFDMLMRTGFYVWSSYPRHFYLHHSDNIYSHFSNQDFDKLVAEADAAVDPALQKELYTELQRQTLELLPAFYLVHREKAVAAGPRVNGYNISAETPWLNLNGIRLTQ